VVSHILAIALHLGGGSDISWWVKVAYIIRCAWRAQYQHSFTNICNVHSLAVSQGQGVVFWAERSGGWVLQLLAL